MKLKPLVFIFVLSGVLGLAALPSQSRAAENVTQLIRASQRAQADGKLGEAVELARRAVEIDPAHPAAWRQQGVALLRNGQAPAAVEALQRAVALDEQDAEAWRGLALAQWQTEQHNEAVRALSAYLRLKPEDAGGWRDLAAWLSRLERGDQAVAALERVVALNPDDASAWCELGAWHLRLGRDGAAAEALGKGVALKPDNLSAWRDLATALTREGKLEPAVAARERVVALAPQDADAWRALARLHQRREHRDEAAQAFERALAIRRGDPASLRDLGWIRWSQGRRDEAVEYLTEAVLGGVEAREHVIGQVVAGLAEAGAGDQALAFLRKVNPKETPSVQGLALARAGRLRAADPILASAWQAGERTPDIGLYLAYVRAVNAQFVGIDAYLEPLLATAGALTPERADLALEVLRLGGNRPEAPTLVSRLEAGLAQRDRYSQRVTDILETAAAARRVNDQPEQALALYRRVLERDPNRACWIWAVLLAEKVEGHTPFAWLDALAKQVSTPARTAGVLGLRADRQGRADAAIDALRISLALDPFQPPLRQILFRNLREQGRVEEARAEADWFAQQVEAGESVLRSYLAEMLTRLGDTEAALEQWEVLHYSTPEMPYYGLETATALFQLGRADEAVDLLRGLVAVSSDPRIFEMLAEIASARAHYAEAAEWARQGLAAAPPTQGLLRYQAENLDKLGTNAPVALAAAQAFLVRDPGYVPLTMLAGRLLETTGATNSAMAFQQELLARNPDFVPALSALRDQSTRAGEIDEAVEYARRHVEIQPGNAEAHRAYANVLAQQDRFRASLQVLRPLARMPIKLAMPVLVYQEITVNPYAGRNSVAQIGDHIEQLAAAGYSFVNAFGQIDAHTNSHQVMLVLLDPEAAVIEALDPVLIRHGARVVYVGQAAVPAVTLTGTPYPDSVKPLLSGERWQLAAGGPPGLRRQPVDATGRLGNPLTHPVMTETGLESEFDFATRLDHTLAKAAGTLNRQNERIWFYPSGDFGQRSLDTGTNHVAALRVAVGQHFTHAVYLDDSGFFLLDDAADRLRIPARAVPPDWDAAALAVYLGAGHPLTRARLELARVLYWNGQHEAAHAAFAEAERAGADRRDLLFNRGMNAERQGDTPSAKENLLAAQALDPDSERIDEALARLIEDRRPQATAFLSGWRDNEDRDYLRYGLFGDAYVSERLRFGALVDRNRWSTDDMGEEKGTRYGLRGQAFLADQIWLSGSLWRLDMDDVADHWGGDAALRLPNPLLSGSLTLTVAREEIETVEALRADIDANIYALRTYTRLLDVFDLFTDLSLTARSDGNDTPMLEGRLLYRVQEWPYTGIGWRFRFADSDRDPDEYWAPEELEQHQLHFTLRGAWKILSYTASADAGYARERDTDWRFVWGARGTAECAITRRISLFGELGYFEGPEYNRHFGRVGLTGRF